MTGKQLKADISEEKAKTGPVPYPDPYKEMHAGRKSWPVSRQYKLEQFGVSRIELPAGKWSTQRHWHLKNDECVILISGELVLVTDEGEEIIRPGDCVCFKAGVPNPHHFQNRSDQPAIYYDIGGRDCYDVSTFPDMGFEVRIKMDLDFRPIVK